MNHALRTEYDDEQEMYSEMSALTCTDESRAIQSQAEEADINTIVRRFGITGHLPVVDRPMYAGDFSDVDDFQSAMNAVRRGEEAFMALPAEVRTEFRNDPQRYFEFCTEVDENGSLRNLERMRKMGLAVPAVEPEPEKVQKVEVVNPPKEE